MQPAQERYEDIGQALRAAREGHGLSLLETAQQLHIRAKYLHALEEGYLDELPGNAYIRGYLQNYAEFLGLDKIEIIRRYEQLQNRRKEQEFYVPEPTRKENTPTPMMLGLGAGIVAAGLLIWAIFLHQPTSHIVQVNEVPEAFTQIVSERFRMTNKLYGCFEAEDKLTYPFCSAPAIEWPEEHWFHTPIFSVAQNDDA